MLDYNVDDQGNLAPIVGGRFDIVAHSMGGLVARHFATRITLAQNSILCEMSG